MLSARLCWESSHAGYEGPVVAGVVVVVVVVAVVGVGVLGMVEVAVAVVVAAVEVLSCWLATLLSEG